MKEEGEDAVKLQYNAHCASNQWQHRSQMKGGGGCLSKDEEDLASSWH